MSRNRPAPCGPAGVARSATGSLELAELVTTPLLPADYLDLFAPLRAGADAARPDRGGPPRDRATPPRW